MFKSSFGSNSFITTKWFSLLLEQICDEHGASLFILLFHVMFSALQVLFPCQLGDKNLDHILLEGRQVFALFPWNAKPTWLHCIRWAVSSTSLHERVYCRWGLQKKFSIPSDAVAPNAVVHKIPVKHRLFIKMGPWFLIFGGNSIPIPTVKDQFVPSAWNIDESSIWSVCVCIVYLCGWDPIWWGSPPPYLSAHKILRQWARQASFGPSFYVRDLPWPLFKK